MASSLCPGADSQKPPPFQGLCVHPSFVHMKEDRRPLTTTFVLPSQR